MALDVSGGMMMVSLMVPSSSIQAQPGRAAGARDEGPADQGREARMSERALNQWDAEDRKRR
jgi:hypothetical protein